jgi:hypothetical protein
MAAVSFLSARVAAFAPGAFRQSLGGKRSGLRARHVKNFKLDIRKPIESDRRLTLIWTSEESAALRNPPD